MAAKAKPGDVTGRKRAELAEQNAEAMETRAAEVTMATAQAAVKLETEVIDATKPHQTTIVVDAATKVARDSDQDTVTIRVIETIESMTFGAGNHYTFKAGQKYEVTRDVARHLESKGYLAGVI